MLGVSVVIRLTEGGERVGQLMAEAKDINPQITPEVVTEEVKVATEEIVAETKEEVREAPSRLRQRLRELEALWERTGVQFYHVPMN